MSNNHIPLKSIREIYLGSLKTNVKKQYQTWKIEGICFHSVPNVHVTLISHHHFSTSILRTLK